MFIIATWLALSTLMNRERESVASWEPFRRHALKTVWAFEGLERNGQSAGEWGNGSFDRLAMLQNLRSNYKSMISKPGSDPLELELAVLNHRLAMEISDTAEKSGLIEEGRRFLDRRWPEHPDSYHTQAQKVLGGTPLTNEDLKHLREMIGKWPSFWPLYHLLLQTEKLPEHLLLDFQNHANQAKLDIRAANFQCLSALVLSIPGLFFLAFGLKRFYRPIRPSLERLHSLWRPEHMVATFAISMLFSQFVGLILSNTGGFNLEWLGGAGTLAWWTVQAFNHLFFALLVLLPVYWLLAGYVRRKRWFAAALSYSAADLKSPHAWIAATCMACTTLISCLCLGFFFEKVGWKADPADWVSRSFAEWGKMSLPLSLFWGALVAPVAEESLFRGLLFRAFRRPLGPALAAMISSSLFAASHYYSLQGFVMVFLMGMVFAWVFHRTGRLAAAMMTHSMVNVFWSIYDFIWLQ